MQLGEAYLFKLEKWLGLRRQFHNSNGDGHPGGFFKKHRKYMKRWKKANQLRVYQDKNGLTLAAFATADCCDLERVVESLKTQDRFTTCELTTDAPSMSNALCNALHLKSTFLNGDEVSHVYCFDVGAVVMWNLTHGQREEMLKFLTSFEEGSYAYNLVRSSSELLIYKYARCKSSYLYDNTLYFGVAEKSSDLIALNRFLISCAISLSTKVSAFEGMIENHLCCMESTAAQMKAGKGLKMKQKQVLGIAGTAYSTKHNLKISTDCLLMPCKILSRYRSDEEQESFANACIYFSVPQRLELFENNLVLCECYINLLLNHFSYSQNRRFQKILLTVLGIGGIGLAYNYIKNCL